MTAIKAYQIIFNYQKWRIGDKDKFDYSPKELTEAINKALEILKKQ